MKKMFDHELPLLEALQKIAPQSSNNTLRKWVQDGRVLVDGNPARKLFTVAAGQTIEIVEKRIKKQGTLEILYEDAHFVVIDKPAHLLSVSTNFETKKTAHALLKERYPKKKVFVIHRLDQDTSGVMIFALTEQAYEHLKAELASHKMERIYYAVLEGKLTGKGTWDSYLYEDQNYKVHVSKDAAVGERAITHYTVEKTGNLVSLVRFQLQTGKKNQIRVHAAHSGHPVAGDIKYGAKLDITRRLLLHSHSLTLTHPFTKKRMSFTSPVPAQFAATLKN